MWSDILATITATVVFFSIVKLIFILRFNRRISMLASTLKHSAKDMATFSIVFSIVMAAYSSFAYVTLGGKLADYATFLTTIQSLFAMILGSFNYEEITRAHPILGPIFFFSFVVVMMFILLNMFLSIINDTFTQVKADANKQSNDYEIIDFMFARFQTFTGLNISKAIEKMKHKYFKGMSYCKHGSLSLV